MRLTAKKVIQNGFAQKIWEKIGRILKSKEENTQIGAWHCILKYFLWVARQ